VKHGKIMVALVAALVTMAAMSVASASAAETVICKKTRAVSNPCAKADIQPAGQGFGLGVTRFTIGAGSESRLKCGGGAGFQVVGVLGFASTAGAGAPLPGLSETNVMNGSCEGFESGSCSSVSPTDPAVTMQSNTTSSATIAMGTAGSPLAVSFTCSTIFGPISCTYAATNSVNLEVNDVKHTVTAKAPVKRTGFSGGGLGEALCAEGQTLEIDGFSLGEGEGNHINIA
jgi:hypothetical protein